MGIPFTKMHGLGNDYIYVNGFEVELADPGTVAKQISDRHRGVGSDGLVLILPSERADFRMRMWNSDGSEAEQCGNALRCIARYVFERGLTDRTAFTIETGAGDVHAVLEVTPAKNGGPGRVAAVETDLGPPMLTPERIPVVGSQSSERLIGESWM
ncbi:MAG TPA: diaminopimelate epimerase, partial [Candidatus Udaeobacter sp.]|nr:diaminopimelate epimerase [Candidatus Udaeobacter sp.]